MTEKRFTLAYEKGNWWAVKDYDITLWKEDVIFLMNKLYEENIQLRKDNEELHLQLNLTADQRNEFHRGARENANRVGELKKENKQLKQELTDCKEKKQQMKEFFMNSETVLEQKKLQELIYQTVINLIDEKIKYYEHKPFSASISNPMSVNFDEDVDRLARLSELEQLKKELES